MAKFVAVSREAHAQKVWRRFANYQFAAKEPLASIVLAEVVHFGSWMPLVFIEEAGRYVLMAMMSPMPGHNLFVGPDGEWLGGYAPSSLRSHPFRLVRREGAEQMTLYIDEDSGVIRDADEAGEPFFAADGCGGDIPECGQHPFRCLTSCVSRRPGETTRGRRA